MLFLVSDKLEKLSIKCNSYPNLLNVIALLSLSFYIIEVHFLHFAENHTLSFVFSLKLYLTQLIKLTS